MNAPVSASPAVGGPPGALRVLDRIAGVLQRPSLVVGVLVGLVALVRVLPVPVVQDLGFTDDATYLRSGVFVREVPVRGAEAPVFAWWYWGVSHLVGSRVATQFVVYLVLGTGVGLTVFVLARALGARRGPAALAAMVLIGSALPVVRPTVGTFATVVLGGSVALAWRWRDRPVFWPVLTVGVALVTWSRPEFVVALAVVLVLAALSVWVGRGAADRRGSLLALVGCGLVVVVGWAAFGSPVAGARQWVAFCQHEGYARAVLGDDAVVNPWLDAGSVCRATYGDASSIVAAAVERPGAVAAHLGRAVRLTPSSVRDALGGGATGPVRNRLAIATGLVMVAAAGWVVVRRRRRIAGRVRAAGLPGAALVAVLLPSVLSIVVIHPRFHHLVLPVAFGLAVTAVVLSRVRPGAFTTVGLPAAALLVIVVAGAAAVEASAVRSDRPGLALIAELRRRHVAGDLDRVVSFGGDVSAYVPGLRSVPPPVTAPDDLAAWLDRRDVDAVVLAPGARAWARAGAPAPIAAFLRDPERSGWALVATPGDDVAIVAPPDSRRAADRGVAWSSPRGRSSAG